MKSSIISNLPYYFNYTFLLINNTASSVVGKTRRRKIDRLTWMTDRLLMGFYLGILKFNYYIKWPITLLNHTPWLEKILKFMLSNGPKQPWGNTHIASPNVKVTFLIKKISIWLAAGPPKIRAIRDRSPKQQVPRKYEKIRSPCNPFLFQSPQNWNRTFYEICTWPHFFF